MKLTLELFGRFRKYHKEKIFELFLEDSSTVKELLSRLKIPDTVDCWVLVNGSPCVRNHILHNNDAISIFEPKGGG